MLQIYRTVSHVDGWQGLAQFEIRGARYIELFPMLTVGKDYLSTK
ncbi:TPA: hypothetical protein ACGF86_003477 [Vibrio cholerae]